MSQEDIFKLLLIVLLLSNEKDNCKSESRSRFSSLNEVIIIVMLFSLFNSSNDETDLLPINTSF